MDSALGEFCELTENWFRRAFSAPTGVQEAAWKSILSGCDTLVTAPTGTGKTLSAFLVFIDRLVREAQNGGLEDSVRVIYISPLKSLAADIRENLKRPLDGIADLSRERKISPPVIRTAVRTGDTSPSERRAALKRPPHIFITTPESLYLLLTSVSGQNMLKTARAVIVDELHALINSKRGAHLMMSLERLDALAGTPLQRIGLSATITPASLAADYLSPRGAEIAAPPHVKKVRIKTVSPFPESGFLPEGTVWPDIARVVLQTAAAARTAIVFCDARTTAEKLAFYINQAAGEGYALAHHGSVSKEQRHETETRLRAGDLRLLCATSSMELGIDIGDIDVVIQVACPKNISSALQRLGRAGHAPGRVSEMMIIPRMNGEILNCVLTAKAASEGQIEQSRPPRGCLDILAQHIVSMTAVRGYTTSEIFETAKRAYPFRGITREDVASVLKMLAGDYEHNREIPVRPRVLYDRINETVSGDNYTRLLALSSGGTIPDKGQFAVKTEGGVKLGEVDEEFTFEVRVGEKFLLGAFAWRIKSITKDTVYVEQTNTEGAAVPFWKNEWFARETDTGRRFGETLRELSAIDDAEVLADRIIAFGSDEACAERAAEFILSQKRAAERIPDDRTLIAEHFKDETGAPQLMIHSIFGRRVNQPLAILAAAAAERIAGMDIGSFDEDDGFLLFSRSSGIIPERLLFAIDPDTAEQYLSAVLPDTPVFSVTFRYSLARALMMGSRARGRNPLWIQRLRAAETLETVVRLPEHPIMREARRECLEDLWDIDGVVTLLRDIQSGKTAVHEVRTVMPSPMSLPLRRAAEAALMYDYAPTPAGVSQTVFEITDKSELLKPAREHLAAAEQPPPADAEALHTRLMIEGDALASELQVPAEFFNALTEAGRIAYIEPGLWIAAEHTGIYDNAMTHGDLSTRRDIVRRMLRYRGGHTAESAASRYFWTEEEASAVLNALAAGGEAVCDGGTYYHAGAYETARRVTVKDRRQAVETRPARAFASLLASRRTINASRGEQLLYAVKTLRGEVYTPEMWEKYIFPARVRSYTPELLDKILTAGEAFWTYTENGAAFYLPEDSNWESEPVMPEDLTAEEQMVYDRLKTRGASFARSLDVPGSSAAETLYPLISKGAVRSDNFAPLRYMKNAAQADKRHIRARVSALEGRFELSRPPRVLSAEDMLLRAFEKTGVLSRETVSGMTWTAALEILRLWELTGRVRRGYFVSGLSGAQFVLSHEFDALTHALAAPENDVVWLHANDPAMAWGRYLAHEPGRAFIAVPGTAAAMRGGEVIAVFERQGAVLRVFTGDFLPALTAFTKDFSSGAIYPGTRRVCVRTYPEKAAEALQTAGFSRMMNDFELYRSAL